ncbi:antitoxin Xre/MbcA/ParS toxin-binding domain-containing protein [Nevskia ramosa]|uniref:antitoxin Xre/MbcA/ParS toxin-binding domain-containing protein n=1 Tax=Nevskia ramosa TaxID=64002 RepID=UPI0003B78454
MEIRNSSSTSYSVASGGKRRGAQPAAASEAAPVLSKAVVRAAGRLALSQVQLAKALGLSPATASRLNAGTWTLAPDSKPWELATLLVRVYRSLDAITGGKVEAMQAWLHSGNSALGGEPAKLLGSCEGLIHVLQYLDASRSRI